MLVTRKLEYLPKPYPDNIIATIGPERVDKVAVHFDLNDISGLASLVTKTILGRSEESQ